MSIDLLMYLAEWKMSLSLNICCILNYQTDDKLKLYIIIQTHCAVMQGLMH